MSEFSIDLVLQSESLDNVSIEIAKALTKIQTALNAQGNKEQNLNLNLQNQFKPLTAGINSSLLALGGFSKSLMGISKNLSSLETKLQGITSSLEVGSAKIKGTSEVNASSVTFDTSALSLVLKGTKEVTLLAEQISIKELALSVKVPESLSVAAQLESLVPIPVTVELPSAASVQGVIQEITPIEVNVTLDKDVSVSGVLKAGKEIDVEIDKTQLTPKINVLPVDLKLSGLIQKQLITKLTVAPISLGASFSTDLKAKIKEALNSTSYIVPDIDLSNVLKQLEQDLAAKLNNAGADFDISEAIKTFEASLASKATSTAGLTTTPEITVAPITLKLSTLVQRAVSEAITVDPIKLGSTFGAELKKLITGALSIAEVTIDTSKVTTALTKFTDDLASELSNAASDFNVAEAVTLLESRIVDFINDAKPSKVVPSSQGVGSRLEIAKDLPVKVLLPKQASVKGAISLPKELGTKVNIPKQVDIEGKVIAPAEIKVRVNTPEDVTVDPVLELPESIEVTVILDEKLSVSGVLKSNKNIEIEIDEKQLTPNINLLPVDLKLAGLIQKQLLSKLSVAPITLNATFATDLKNKIKEALSVQSFSIPGIDLTEAVNTLQNEISSKLNSASSDFDITPAIENLKTVLKTKLSSSIGSVSTPETTVAPITLKLSGLVQKSVAEALTVDPIKLGSSFGSELKKLINEALTVAEIQLDVSKLTKSLDKLTEDLSSELNNAADDFSIAEAVTLLENRIVSFINDAKPSKVVLASDTAVKSALSIAKDVPVKVLLPKQVSVKGAVVLPKDLAVKVDTVKEITVKGSVSKPKDVSVDLEIPEVVKVNTVIPDENTIEGYLDLPKTLDIAVKLPELASVKGIFELPKKVLVKVLTEEEITVQSDLISDFTDALALVKVRLDKASTDLIAKLEGYDLNVNPITDAIDGFILDIASQFKKALEIGNIQKLKNITKETKAAAAVSNNTSDISFKDEILKLSNLITDAVIEAGSAIEFKDSIELLNSKIKAEVESSDFDFKTSIELLNKKLELAVGSVNFNVDSQIDILSVGISSLFSRLKEAVDKIQPGSVVGESVNTVSEKELARRAAILKAAPKIKEAQELGEIPTGKISGSTKEGKARNALALEKANKTLNILNSLGTSISDIGRTEAEAIANLVRELENVLKDLTPATTEAVLLIKSLSQRVDMAAEKSEILKNSLASERASEFQLLEPSEDITASIRVRKPKENTVITPNETTIEGGTPRDIRNANKAIQKETKELAFDLRVLSKEVEKGNTSVGKALQNFSDSVSMTATVLGLTVEELSQLNPGALRKDLQDSLTAEGVKFTASGALGFGQNELSSTEAESATGIGGMLDILASFPSAFIQAQLGNTTENQDAFKQVTEAGKEFAQYAGKAGKELYASPTAKAAAESIGKSIKASATTAADIYRSAQRVENATLGVFGIFGKAAKFSLQAVAAQTTLGNLGLGEAGSFLGQGISSIASIAGDIAKSNTGAFGAGLTIDAITGAIKAAAPLIGLGIVTGVATKSIDQLVPDNNPEISQLEGKITNLTTGLAEISKAVIDNAVDAKSEEVKSAGKQLIEDAKAKTVEPIAVEVAEPPAVKKNQEVAAKKAAEKPVDTEVKSEVEVEAKVKAKKEEKVVTEVEPETKPKKEPKAKAEPKPVKEPKPAKEPKTEGISKPKPNVEPDVKSVNFKDAFKDLQNQLTQAALVAKEAPTATNLNKLKQLSDVGLASLRPKSTARGQEVVDQRNVLDAEAARTALRLKSLTKSSTLAPIGTTPREEVNRVFKSVESKISTGEFTEAENILNTTRATKSTDTKESQAIDPAIIAKFDQLQIKLDDAILSKAVNELKVEIKQARVSGKADFQKLTGLANSLSALKSTKAKEAGLDAGLDIKRLETALAGINTKDFNEALRIAGSQSSIGNFDDAQDTLSNARQLASSELQNNKVTAAEQKIDSDSLKLLFDRFLSDVAKLDLAGVSDKGITDLKTVALKFANFPDLALKARNKINSLESKLPVVTDTRFQDNLDKSKSALNVNDFDNAKLYAENAKTVAESTEQFNKVNAVLDNVQSKLIKSQVKSVKEDINSLKREGVTPEGLQKIEDKVSNVQSKAEQDKLILTLRNLIPKPKKDNEFGELIQLLKKQKDLNKDFDPADISRLQSLADTESKVLDIEKLTSVKIPVNAAQPKKEKDQFPAQEQLVRSKIKNGTVQESDIETLKGLVKNTNQAEKLLTILKAIEKVEIDKAFKVFKQQAEAILNSGNKIKPSQAAFLNNQAEQFKGTGQESNVNKLTAKLTEATDGFKTLFNLVSNNLKNGLIPEPEQLNKLSSLASNDTQVADVKALRTEVKESRINTEFLSFLTSIEVLKNNADKSAEAVATVAQNALLFKGTIKEVQALTASRKFASGIKPVDEFKDELKTQQKRKQIGLEVSTTSLDRLANTDIEKALVNKLKDSINESELEAAFKGFSELIQKATNDIKLGIKDEETLNQITQGSELFLGTTRETDAETKLVSLQSVAEAQNNRDFKDAKTIVTNDLPGYDKAIEFIEELAESSTKLSSQAQKFLELKDASKQLAEFSNEIIQIQRALSKPGANVPVLLGNLEAVQASFESSTVAGNKSIEGRIFSVNNQGIAKQGTQQGNDFTKANLLAKEGRTEEARSIFEKLASESTNVGSQARIALRKLNQVFDKLTLEQDDLLKQLTAKFNSLKATAKNTGDFTNLKEFAGQVKSVNENESSEGLFKNRINKLAQDVEFASNPTIKEAKESKEREDRLSITDLRSAFELLRGGLATTVDGLRTLASAASRTSINLAKLELANKGTVGQTAKDFEFAKKQATDTGISEQSTLADLASFKLAIPGADKLDSNGNKVSQSVGSPEIEKILKGLQAAGTANQLSGAEQDGASNAILQILSKGQVQSEELKRQLANFIPGTVANFAEGQGIDTSELESRLKRGEVGIDALIGFTDVLQKKFGKIAEKDTPTKAVNKLTGNLQELGLRAAIPGGAALQAGLGVINPVLGGLKDSASSLSTIGSTVGLVVGGAILKETVNQLDSTAIGKILQKSAGLFVLDPAASFKEQALSGKLSTLGKVSSLTIGAGVLSATTSALSKALTGEDANGLDTLFAKAGKNLESQLKGIFKALENPFNLDVNKDKNSGAAKDTLLADVFTQIIPAALLFGAAIQGLTGVIENTKTRLQASNLKDALPETTIKPGSVNLNTSSSLPLAFPSDGMVKKGVNLNSISEKTTSPIVSGVAKGASAIGSGVSALGGAALGLLTNPLTAVVAPLVLALGTYGLSTTTFQSKFEEETQKQIDATKENTAALRAKNGDLKGGLGSKQSADSGAFGINTRDRNARDENILNGINDGVSEERIGLVTNFGLNQEKKRATNQLAKGIKEEKNFLGQTTRDNQKSKDLVTNELNRRAKGGAVSEEFKSTNASQALFERDLKVATEALEAFATELDLSGKSVVRTAAETERIAKNRTDLVSTQNELKALNEAVPSNDPAENRRRASRKTDLTSKLEEARKQDLEDTIKPSREKITAASDALKKVKAAKQEFTVSTLINNEEAINSEEYKVKIAQFEKAEKTIQAELKKRKADNALVDPAEIISRASTNKENADIAADRNAQGRNLIISGKEKASIDQRKSEGNDRAASVRSAEITIETNESDLQTLQDKLSAAKDLQATVELNVSGEDYSKKIEEANANVLALTLEVEKKKTDISTAELNKRIAIESNLIEEAERKRAKQERKLSTQEAQGQLGNKVDASFQFNINNARLAEAASIRQESVGNQQVRDQEIIVARTVIGKEAQQDKLDDLKVAAIQKSAARQSATRSRQEAEEQRLFTVAEIQSSNRNRELTNTNSKASRIQQTFSGADSVISAKQAENVSGRNTDAARVDIEKQIAVLAATRFERESQSQKLEELKSAKLQKDTDLYLATLSRIRAEYELLASTIEATRIARENQSKAVVNKAVDNNEVAKAISTRSIKNDLAGTDTSARDEKANIVNLQNNRRAEDNAAVTRQRNSISDFNAKSGGLGFTAQFTESDRQSFGKLQPDQLTGIISNATKAQETLQQNKAKGINTPVSFEANGKQITTDNFTFIEAFKDLINQFTEIAEKRRTDNLAIFQAKEAANNSSIDRASNSSRNTEQLKFDTQAAKEAEVINKKGRDDRQADRIKLSKNKKENPIETIVTTGITSFKSATAAKQIADDKLRTDASKVDRTLRANRDQAISAGQNAEANSLAAEIEANANKLQADLSTTDFSGLESTLDGVLSEVKRQTAQGDRILDLTQEQVNRERSVFELRKSLGLIQETDKQASTREINNKIDDSNSAIARAKKALEKEATPENAIAQLDLLSAATKENPEAKGLVTSTRAAVVQLLASGEDVSGVINKFKASLDGLAITAEERANAIQFASEKIDRANKLEEQQTLSDLASSQETLPLKRSTGRFSGIENVAAQNNNIRRRADRTFNLEIAKIDNEEFANRDGLTPEQKRIKFGAKREIAKNNRDIDLDGIRSESRELANDITDVITSNLKFDKFFKDILTDGDIGKAAASIGESLFDGLANYFSQKAQKSLNDVIGSFFENLFDGLFGVIKDKAKGAVKPDLLSAGIESVTTPLLESPVLASIAAAKTYPSDISKVDNIIPPSIGERSIFSPYHEQNMLPPREQTSKMSLTADNYVGVSQAEGDLSVVPDLGDNRSNLPNTENIAPVVQSNAENTLALNANTQAILGSKSNLSTETKGLPGSDQIPGVEGLSFSEDSTTDKISGDSTINRLTDDLRGVNLAEDEAFSKGLPSTIDSLSPALETFRSGLDATRDPLGSFVNALLSGVSGGDSGGGGGLGGLFSSLVGGLFGGGGGSDVGSSVLGDLGGSFGLPSFADGNIREARNMPRTPAKDPRERGMDSRLAVVNSQELIVPAGMAQQFLDFSAGLSSESISNNVSNNSSTSNISNSNSSVNNNYSVNNDSFGRSLAASVVIQDKVNDQRKRFNGNG